MNNNIPIDENLMQEIQNQLDKLIKESDLNSDEEYLSELQEYLGFNFGDLSDEMQKAHQTRKLGIKKVHEDAIIPKYAYPSDSGFDLYSVEDMLIKPFGRALVSTGLKFEFDENLELQIRPKSGLALNMGLTVLNTPGTIDQGYTDEVKVILFNSSGNNIIIEKGTKIAQGVLSPVVNGKYVQIEEITVISDKDRNNNGFGSTGIK